MIYRRREGCAFIATRGFISQQPAIFRRRICDASPNNVGSAKLKASLRPRNEVTSAPVRSSATRIARELVDRGSLRKADEALFACQTDARSGKMRGVVESRTRHITFLLDDVHGVHNLAAVVRSCDAWGIADLHCVLTVEPDCLSLGRADKNGSGDRKQDGKRFHRHGQSLMELFERESTRRVSKNAHKWVSISEYTTTQQAVVALKSRGYHICVSSLDPAAKPIGQVSLERPIAFVFGNEHSGVSRELFEAADSRFTVPMYGFVESTNISVAAATVASHAVERARKEKAESLHPGEYFLSAEEQAELYHRFLLPNPQVPRKIQQITSKFDVTRLGSQLERRIVTEGMFVDSRKGLQALDSASIVHFLEEKVRFGAETGAIVRRYFVKRVKAGALGDRQFEKRAASISDGLAGLGALSCESCMIGLSEEVTPPSFASRQRILPAFRALIREVNRGYSKLFDESAAPLLPVDASETERAFTDQALVSRTQAWRATVEVLGGSVEELQDVVTRASVLDIARVLASSMKCCPVGVRKWESAAKSLRVDDIDRLSELLRAREPLRSAYVTDVASFGVGAPNVLSELSPRELKILHFVLRLFQVGHCVSCVHQTAWERETSRGSRLIQSMRFGLLEATLVDQVAEMRLLGAEEALKQARCIYELMCSIEEIRTASKAHV